MVSPFCWNYYSFPNDVHRSWNSRIIQDVNFMKNFLSLSLFSFLFRESKFKKRTNLTILEISKIFAKNRRFFLYPKIMIILSTEIISAVILRNEVISQKSNDFAIRWFMLCIRGIWVIPRVLISRRVIDLEFISSSIYDRSIIIWIYQNSTNRRTTDFPDIRRITKAR